MASGLAVEDSGSLDLSAGEQEGAARGVEVDEPLPAPDLDRVAGEGMITSGHRSSAQQDGVDASSNMDFIDVREDTQAASEVVERSRITSTSEDVAIREVEDKRVDKESAPAGAEMVSVPEVEFGSLDFAQQEVAAASCEDPHPEVGVSKGSSEEVDGKDHGNVTQEVEQADSTGRDINIQEEDCSPTQEATVSGVVEAQTGSVSGVDETDACDDLSNCDSAHHDVGGTPCDILEVNAGMEEECKAAIVDEPSVVGDQLEVKVVQSSSGCDNVEENIDLQQEKEKYITDGSLRSYHIEGTIQDALEVMQDSMVQGSDDKLDGNDKKMAMDEALDANDSLRINDQQNMVEVAEPSNETELTKNFCSCLDDTTAMDSAGVGRNKDECLADAVVGSDSAVTVESRGATVKEKKSYGSQLQIHPIASLEIQGTHMADAECQTRLDTLEGDATVDHMEAKIIFKDISFTEEKSCMDNKLMDHNLLDSHHDVTEQPQGSDLNSTGCHVMAAENEASVSDVEVKTERLAKACDVVKAHVEVLEVSNGSELMMNSELVTDNCSSVNEVMNHDTVEQFQAVEGIGLSEDINTNENSVAECTDNMDENQEALPLQMNQKGTLVPAGETEVGGINQNGLEVDNAIHGKEINTQKTPTGIGSNLLNIGPSEETSKNLDLDDKNVSDNAGCSIGCPNTMSDAQVYESRDSLLADEKPIKNQDVTVPSAWSSIESKASDICSTNCNLMEKEYFVMEGLNLSVEISVPTASKLSEIQAVISQDIKLADQINTVQHNLVNPGDTNMDGEHELFEGSEKNVTNIYHSAGENFGNGSTEFSADPKVGIYKVRGKGNQSNNQLVDIQSEKTFLEPTDVEVACELANGGQSEAGAETSGEPVAVYTGKIRKVPDSDSDSDGRKKKKLDSLGDMEMKLTSPNFSSSFKVGECIRRVASQLTGSPSILRSHVEASHKIAAKDDSVFDVFISDTAHDSSMHSPKTKMTNPEDYSQDELLSQLCAAAVDPMVGCSFVGELFTFFTDFRNFCVVSSTEQSLPEKSRRGRKRKVETQSIASILITDHMQESYWSDLASHHSVVNGQRSKEATTIRSQRRKRKASVQTSLPPSVPVLQNAECRQAVVGSPHMNPLLIAERSIIRVEENMVGECSPTALILNFSQLKPLPSSTELIRIFSRYGPLKEASTEVQKKDNCVKVVFQRHADAEIAFSSIGKYGIFGPSLVSYRLRYLLLTPDPSPVTELQESDVIPFEDVNFKNLDNCQIVFMSPDNESEEVPTEGSNLGTPHNYSVVYASPGSKSEDKNDAVPVEDKSFETTGSHQADYVSPDGKLQDENVVPMELSSLIPDNFQASYTSTDPSLQDKSDMVTMEHGNLETPDICQGNTSPNVRLQAENDVPLENSNLEISDICKAAYASHDTKSHDKNNAVPIEDSNLETSDISPSLDLQVDDTIPMEDNNIQIPTSCQGAYVSVDTKSQDKNGAVPMEDGNREAPDIYQGNAFQDTKLQDKNDTVPMEGSNLKSPDSHQIAYILPDTKSQEKNVVPMESEICQGAYASPDDTSQDKRDPNPLEDSNLDVPGSSETASITVSQDKNDGVPMKDGTVETPDIFQGSEDKAAVSFEYSDCEAPEQTVLASSDVKSAKDDAVTFIDSSLITPDDSWTYCTPDTKPQDKNDAVPTEDGILETPNNSQIACTSPDIKLKNKIDAVPVEFDIREDSEDCHIACSSSDTKSQEKDNAVLFENNNLDVPGKDGDVVDPMLVEVPSQESIETLPHADEQTG